MEIKTIETLREYIEKKHGFKYSGAQIGVYVKKGIIPSYKIDSSKVLRFDSALIDRFVETSDLFKYAKTTSRYSEGFKDSNEVKKEELPLKAKSSVLLPTGLAVEGAEVYLLLESAAKFDNAAEVLRLIFAEADYYGEQ